MLENQQHATKSPNEQLEKAKEATEEARPNSPLLRQEVEFLGSCRINFRLKTIN
jgi:hypothetical protein